MERIKVIKKSDAWDPFEFDTGFELSERLPSRFVAHIIADKDNKCTKLFFDFNRVGCVLSDNSNRDDGFRYHDIFHIAFATFLEWSPLLRKILSRKRKSSATLDVFEDGGRAIATEEAVCLVLHSYIDKKISLDEAVTLCRVLTRDLEVSVCTEEIWSFTFESCKRIFEEALSANGIGLVCDRSLSLLGYWPIKRANLRIVK